MQTVHVPLAERGYCIRIGFQTLDGLGGACREARLDGHVLVITDTVVAPLYATQVVRSLERADYTVRTAVMPAGEEHKHVETVSHLYGVALEGALDRRSFIVALGGGVVGDVAGFVAATLLRGLRYVQVPTTIIAQVDSSVGGKTGVDHPRGKNLIGAFHQPSLVWIDTAVLSTLDRRQIRSGLAEIIKYGFIQDADFLTWLENQIERLLALEPEPVAHAVRRCCELKAEIVVRDERETTGLRAVFNFGHTTGHAIETLTGYAGVLHGEGVAIGMVVESVVAREMGLVDSAYVERVRLLCRRAGLPVTVPELDQDALIAAMRRDKKNVGGSIAMTLPDRVGHVALVPDVPEPTVRTALTVCRAT